MAFRCMESEADYFNSAMEVVDTLVVVVVTPAVEAVDIKAVEAVDTVAVCVSRSYVTQEATYTDSRTTRWLRWWGATTTGRRSLVVTAGADAILSPLLRMRTE